uniref:Microcephalin 1 n=1 Tax=Poecilia formosa TaxID=48698 RepID=A0A096LTJ2_POEFO
MTSSKSSVLKDVVAYVDVWSSDKRANYSKPFIQQLEEMGARVSKGFNKQVTHVVFSYGHQATWKKAKKRDVQLVSVLWVGRCYDDGVRADESLFPALNDEKNPVMKNRQHRCMLPKHSPERTIENDWRLKKKFEKLVKELPLSEPQGKNAVVDTSPIIIDQENGIIYSPALKRSDYMAQRLKDMKEKRENISPTVFSTFSDNLHFVLLDCLFSVRMFDFVMQLLLTAKKTKMCQNLAFTTNKEDVTESEQQKNSDLTANCHSSENVRFKRDKNSLTTGGGNECTVAAGFTEITSVAEENQNKQADGSLQKMVNKTKNFKRNGNIKVFSRLSLAPRTLVMTSMPSEKQQTVLQVVKALGGFSIIDRVCESTTHVVSGEHRRTLNILLGIARGCWILSFEWILWCLEQRQWIPEEPYELSDQFPAAQICRLQRHLSAGEHQQNLFQDQPPIFVSQRSQPPTQSLVELIELCGGTACKTVRQAGICIGKYSGRRPEGSRILSEQWILDSITNLKILPYDNYDLE